MGNLATSVPCATTWRGWKNVGQREPRSPRTIHQSEALLSLRAKSVGIMGLRSEGDDWHAAGMDPMELIEVMELVRGVGGQRSAGCGAPHRSCTEASAAPSGAGFVLLRTAGSREPGADSLHPPLQPFAPPGRGRAVLMRGRGLQGSCRRAVEGVAKVGGLGGDVEDCAGGAFVDGGNGGRGIGPMGRIGPVGLTGGS